MFFSKNNFQVSRSNNQSERKFENKEKALMSRSIKKFSYSFFFLRKNIQKNLRKHFFGPPWDVLLFHHPSPLPQLIFFGLAAGIGKKLNLSRASIVDSPRGLFYEQAKYVSCQRDYSNQFGKGIAHI